MIPSFLLTVLRFAWPWALALCIWGVQEVRLSSARSDLAASITRETVSQSLLDAARKRATDLALLYAGMLPQIDAAVRAQKEADEVRIRSLNDRISALSRVADLHVSALAAGVLNDVAAAANGRDAAATGAPAGRAEAVSGFDFSEADLAEHEAVNAEAYLDAVRMFHECRDIYNAARAAQIGVSK